MTEPYEVEADPLDALAEPGPADDGLGADAAEHDAEDPAPPDDGPDDEAHAADPEVDLGGEG